MIRIPMPMVLTAVILLGAAQGLACSTPTARTAQAAAPSAPDENAADGSATGAPPVRPPH